MKSVLLALGILAIIAFVVLAGGCSSYNHLNTLKQQTDKTWADVQNVYQRRADLIPNLVKTVEGAANFEKSTLTEVTQARQQVTKIELDPNSAPNDPEALKRFQKLQDGLSSALSRLLAVSERYPDLKATAAFRDLQVQLEGTENRIAVERRNFNDAVVSYNTAVNSMPARLYAGAFGFQPKPYFTAREGSDVPPPVNFNFGNATPAPAK
ncbi:LemA family protein [Chthoniobacter flavus Ellin428]|uniref:LemA family protein n=1 Tax=Chthoniobacter flavus Ellin428 TaxID=497964 RepID=B4D732_9BACT|nr:LemA family protein [Chthoniobacter flavus]EDY17683.1 LemA family protein [Chthoniobacter flavus Ellin428]TCO84098.1 LemA protein [Chthoniobacter flavus]